jgi:Holliday junction resolvasome RuvABC endonuclease subunit
MRTPDETEHLKREVIDEFRRLLAATVDKDAAVMVALIKVRQLLDIIYPPAPRNDAADAFAFAMTAWQADAGAQEREDYK